MEDSVDQVCGLLKSLSHPQRLMILCYLSQGEKTVSDLLQVCAITQSQLSQFLIRMKAEGLLKSRRDGRFQYYSIGDPRVARLIQTLEGLFCSR
jgi:DNA-binding transcriptional ArsR family regulator